MLITDYNWEQIREKFSESEKEELRRAVTGETICPRGFVIDESQVNDSIIEKLGRKRTLA